MSTIKKQSNHNFTNKASLKILQKAQMKKKQGYDGKEAGAKYAKIPAGAINKQPNRYLQRISKEYKVIVPKSGTN